MTVLATYESVAIVSTPDTLSGRPRLDGHRIGVQTLGARVTDVGVEGALESYPHLTEAQINAAVQYYEDHPQEMSYIQRVDADVDRYQSHRRYRCRCGETFESPPELMVHVDDRGDIPVESDSDHGMDGSFFEGTLTCVCGETFNDVGHYLEHERGDGSWPREHHFVETIETAYE